MKIVYVFDSLASRGGAERIVINKMDYLATYFDYDITVITCYQSQSQPNAYPLSDKVKQLYLNIPFYSQYKYHYPYRLWVKTAINRRLKKDLKEAITDLDPDILIGMGYFIADIVSKIKCRAKKIIEAHEPRPFTLSDYGLNRSLLSKIYMKHKRRMYFSAVEKNADVVVTLTQGDAIEWKKAKRTEVIPNFTAMPIHKLSEGTAKRIISVGRLEWVKGYDRLIKAWAIVERNHSDWKLDIYGSGTLENELKKMIDDLNIQNLVIHPFTSNITQEYANSSIFVLTSHFEGYSLVLLEAMKTGVPCIAFDIPFGPRDVIDDQKTGYLVEDNNIELMANKISFLIDNPTIRKNFAEASLVKSRQYDVKVIMDCWKKLFERLLAN